MTEYIKRENAKRAVWGCARDTGIDEAPFEYAEGLLEDVPSEDVAPVVRCRECKYAEVSVSPITELWCTRFRINDMAVGDDDFCSYGERKDDETI